MDGTFFLAGAIPTSTGTTFANYSRDAVTKCLIKSQLFFLFNSRSLLMASDRVAYSSLYTKLHGILVLVYRLRPSLWRSNLSARQAV
jgi:hypothetical protein